MALKSVTSHYPSVIRIRYHLRLSAPCNRVLFRFHWGGVLAPGRTIMLTISDPRHSRRDFLRIGSLSLGGLSLPWLLPSAEAALSERPTTDRAVIFLFLHGGPSQIETFDPKMSAPAEHPQRHRRDRRPRLPGVTFGGTFPKLARLADRLAVVRSYHPRRRQPRHQAGRRPGHLRRQSRLRSTPASPA